MRERDWEKTISLFYELEVEAVMDKRLWDLPIIEKNADISKVLALLRAKVHVWVVEDIKSRKLIGVITEHDILNTFAPKRLSAYGFGTQDLKSLYLGTAKNAESIMTTKLIKCSPKTTVKKVLDLMMVNDIRRLPVTDDDTLLGEVTFHAILLKYCTIIGV